MRLKGVLKFNFVYIKITVIFAIMTQPLKKRIRESGIKMSRLAKMIDVTPTYFYMCMSGQRTLSKDKEVIIRKFIEQIPVA